MRKINYIREHNFNISNFVNSYQLLLLEALPKTNRQQSYFCVKGVCAWIQPKCNQNSLYPPTASWHVSHFMCLPKHAWSNLTAFVTQYCLTNQEIKQSLSVLTSKIVNIKFISDIQLTKISEKGITEGEKCRFDTLITVCYDLLALISGGVTNHMTNYGFGYWTDNLVKKPQLLTLARFYFTDRFMFGRNQAKLKHLALGLSQFVKPHSKVSINVSLIRLLCFQHS